MKQAIRRKLREFLGVSDPAQVVPATPDRRVNVNGIMVAQARVSVSLVNPFRPAAHPPSVAPKTVTLAQDDALAPVSNWAYGQLEAGYSEGLQFLGYPYLSELAQRPEYRKISETIAAEMTRRWIKFTASGDDDKSEKLAALETAFRHLKVREVFRKAAEQDGFFGRSHLYIDMGQAMPSELVTPIGSGHDDASKEKVKRGSLKALKNIEAVWCYPTGYNSTDPLAGDWYSPTMWQVQGKPIHATRLLTMVGREVPDILKPAYSFGGLSLSQMAKPYVDNWLRTRQSVADLISNFSVNGIKIDMAASASADPSGDRLFNRVDLFNAFRSNRGTMVIDKEEEFFNVSTPLGTLDALQAQTQEHMASVSGIPLVKLLGISPAGLNASSEGELRVFYDSVHAQQEHMFRPALNCILGFVQLSEFGEVDPDIGFAFEPLWSMDEKDRAEIQKVEAETDEILINNQVILSSEARHRVANDPDTPYAGLDPDLEVDPPEPGELDPVPEPDAGGIFGTQAKA